MGGVYSLQHEADKRRRPGAQEQAERERGRALEAVSDQSLTALAGVSGAINRPAHHDDPVCEYTAIEGYLGSYFPQQPAVVLADTRPSYLALCDLAVALCADTYHRSLNLLHRARSLTVSSNQHGGTGCEKETSGGLKVSP